MAQLSINKTAVGLLIAGVVAFVAVKYWPRSDGAVAPTAAQTGKSTRPPASAPLRVSAVRIVPGPLAEVISATGTLRADEGVELQAEVNGKIVFLRIEEGARVRKGDLLVKLNDADLRATL